jgi:hypothetical protein
MIAALNALLGPDQLNTSEGVTAWTVLASTGGNRGSFFGDQRDPCRERHDMSTAK